MKRKIEKDGGKSVLGWQIWQNRLSEAEFHAVWKDLNENLIDIAPAPVLQIFPPPPSNCFAAHIH